MLEIGTVERPVIPQRLILPRVVRSCSRFSQHTRNSLYNLAISNLYTRYSQRAPPPPSPGDRFPSSPFFSTNTMNGRTGSCLRWHAPTTHGRSLYTRTGFSILYWTSRSLVLELLHLHIPVRYFHVYVRSIDTYGIRYIAREREREYARKSKRQNLWPREALDRAPPKLS